MRKLVLFLVLSPLAAFGQNAVGNITILGATCAVTNACVIDTLATSSSSANITLTGTWSATVQFEASSDGGTTWVAINGTPPSSTTAVTSSTANGVWTFNVGSMTHLRARASALASGSVGVTINASPAPILVGGSSGGTVTSLTATSPVVITPSPTTGVGVISCPTCGTSTGTVTSVTGTTNQIDVATGTTTPVISIDAAFQLPISTGITGLGTGIATFLTTPSSANLAAAVTDETGTGAAVFAGSPALTGTPTAPTAALGTNTTQLATTAGLVAASTPPTNPWYVLGTVVTTNGSVLGVGSNTATVLSMFLDRPLTTTQVSYFIGTTADNTAATYDIGIYTGTPGGTCTLVANVGATAGTTFANAANGMHTFSWAQGSKTLSPGRVYLMFTSSQTGTPASFFQNTPSNLQAYSTAIAVTTGGTAPGTFTCPADGTTQATTQGKWPWEKIF